MDYLLAAFRSRTAASQAYNYIYSRNVVCCLVSTPKEAGAGCGLSLKFLEKDFALVASAMEGAGPVFAGFFRVVENGTRRVVTRI